MIITYKIPSGVMHVNADEFFRLARRPAIRRMLKQLRQDPTAAEEYGPQIREYLLGQEQAEHGRWATGAAKMVMAQTRLREAESRYKQMQSPCYACYTRDKDLLAAAKEDVQNAKYECSQLKREIAEVQKLEQRYKEIQVDAEGMLII